MAPWSRASDHRWGAQVRPLKQLFERSFFMPSSNELFAHAFIHSFTYSFIQKAIFDDLPIYMVI